MKSIHVADDWTIINLQGIRWIERLDSNRYGSSNTEYRLRVKYKGEELNFHYQTPELRDAQYNRLRAALVKETNVTK